MAIDAKVSFINQIQEKMSDVLTVNQMTTLTDNIQQILDSFDMKEYRINDMDTDDMLDEYIKAISIQGKSPKTIKLYRYVIQRMMNHVKIPTREITVHHVRDYLQFHQEKGSANSTVRNIRDILNKYFRWLSDEGLIRTNPMTNIGTIKVPKKRKQVFTTIDLARLNESCNDIRNNIRNKAIINFLQSTGCRVGEMVELNCSDINYETNECTVHGKGDKERKIYLSEVASMYLKEYLLTRKDNNPALFIGIRKNRFTENGVRSMLRVLEKKANVSNHVYPHKFRRTLATGLSKRGMPIQEISRILGHEKVDTTMAYVMLNDDDIKVSYRKYA